ncbi:MAG: lytic transglycosylase domain-containing protein [Geminicoccaceae bacterium]
MLGLGGGAVQAQEREREVRVARLAPAGGEAMQSGAALGRDSSLGSADIVRYRSIFELQEGGDLDRADDLIGRLENPLLLGHVRAQRYLHPTAYASSYQELYRWLEAYADLPQAPRIYRLALKKRPAGVAPPPRPLVVSRGGTETLASTRLSGSAASPADLAAWRKARLALAARNDQAALDRASPAARRSGQAEPKMHWTAGLAAWRLGNYELAAEHFASLANAKAAKPEDAAAGAFWAARAYLMVRRPQVVPHFLRLAAANDGEFYGLIAQTMIGEDSAIDWSRRGPSVDPLLLSFPGVRRALGLAAVGQTELAGDELRLLAGRSGPELSSNLRGLAAQLEMPAAGTSTAQAQLASRDDDDFPLPDLQPKGGYTVDRALIWAMIRAESGFDPRARSHKGAVGLMQIMPETAAQVARKLNVAYKGQATLLRPETNLKLGQAYIHNLRQMKAVQDSLIHICLAYNGGIARVEAWMKDFGDLMNDPLLFLESVPIRETREYAKKVLVNLWTYRARLGQPAPSLAQLAANEWPRFERIETAAVADTLAKAKTTADAGNP